jgi:hypothetical protein
MAIGSIAVKDVVVEAQKIRFWYLRYGGTYLLIKSDKPQIPTEIVGHL